MLRDSPIRARLTSSNPARARFAGIVALGVLLSLPALPAVGASDLDDLLRDPVDFAKGASRESPGGAVTMHVHVIPSWGTSPGVMAVMEASQPWSCSQSSYPTSPEKSLPPLTYVPGSWHASIRCAVPGDGWVNAHKFERDGDWLWALQERVESYCKSPAVAARTSTPVGSLDAWSTCSSPYDGDLTASCTAQILPYPLGAAADATLSLSPACAASASGARARDVEVECGGESTLAFEWKVDCSSLYGTRRTGEYRRWFGVSCPSCEADLQEIVDAVEPLSIRYG